MSVHDNAGLISKPKIIFVCLYIIVAIVEEAYCLQKYKECSTAVGLTWQSHSEQSAEKQTLRIHHSSGSRLRASPCLFIRFFNWLIYFDLQDPQFFSVQPIFHKCHMQIFTIDLFVVAKEKCLTVLIHNSVVVAPDNHF